MLVACTLIDNKGSVRAGVFDASGRLLASAQEVIQLWNPIPNHYEQSSNNIWKACCKAGNHKLHQYTHKFQGPVPCTTLSFSYTTHSAKCNIYGWSRCNNREGDRFWRNLFTVCSLICGMLTPITHSLARVVLDAEDKPVTVSATQHDEQNIILWMDHR
jgi:hypothetical protein